jgi:hypothetical protein
MKPSERRREKQRLKELRVDRARRIQLLLGRGMITDKSEIPDDAIPVDPECSTKALTWSPEIFYRDINFVCSDCAKEECWTADSQKHYFEVLRSSPYKYPKRCYECRQKEIERRDIARKDAGHTQPANSK